MVRDDVGIPVRLVAAHKEVAVFKDNPKRYGRKPDPDFDEPGQSLASALPHGFSVQGNLQLIDAFRDQVHALINSGENDVTEAELRKVVREEIQNVLDGQARRVQGIISWERYLEVLLEAARKN